MKLELVRRLMPMGVGALMLFAFAASPAVADPPLKVAVKGCTGATITGFVGDYQGGALGHMRQFLGIPYAAPPVGINRWQPPQPFCWTGDRASLTSANPICAQSDGSFSAEDCLYLNVFTAPTGTVSKQPVMVFIHGGFFTGGTARNDAHNPLAFMNRGAVVVMINYRLGAFGFLAHPALDKSTKNRGNYAILDQQAALKWIKTNIAAFGGDPNNVTIFGQSAGGMSVLTHLVSPLSTGLFHKAIIQSGTFYYKPTDLATAEAQGVALATSLGCPGTSAATAACLRGLNYKTVLSKQSALGANATLLRVDGVVLPDTFSNLLAAGNFQNVPVMNGANHDEIRFHLVGDARFGTGNTCNYKSNIVPANYQQSLSYFYLSSFVPQVVLQYPAGVSALSANVSHAAARSDVVFHCTSFLVDQWLAAKNKVYAYEFNDATAPNTATGPVKLTDGKPFPLGAYHSAEMQYLFPRVGQPACGINYPGLNAAQKKLADAMVTYWTTFAKTGNPNPASGTKPANWPLYAGPNAQMLSLVAGTPKVETAAAYDAAHQCTGFWDFLLQ